MQVRELCPAIRREGEAESGDEGRASTACDGEGEQIRGGSRHDKRQQERNVVCQRGIAEDPLHGRHDHCHAEQVL